MQHISFTYTHRCTINFLECNYIGSHLLNNFGYSFAVQPVIHSGTMTDIIAHKSDSPLCLNGKSQKNRHE